MGGYCDSVLHEYLLFIPRKTSGKSEYCIPTKAQSIQEKTEIISYSGYIITAPCMEISLTGTGPLQDTIEITREYVRIWFFYSSD
jgi:hypothetical protein